MKKIIFYKLIFFLIYNSSNYNYINFFINKRESLKKKYKEFIIKIAKKEFSLKKYFKKTVKEVFIILLALIIKETIMFFIKIYNKKNILKNNIYNENNILFYYDKFNFKYDSYENNQIFDYFHTQKEKNNDLIYIEIIKLIFNNKEWLLPSILLIIIFFSLNNKKQLYYENIRI